MNVVRLVSVSQKLNSLGYYTQLFWEENREAEFKKKTILSRRSIAAEDYTVRSQL